MAGDYSVEPGAENDGEAEADDPELVIPGSGCHDDISHEAQRLHGSRHVSLDVVAEVRCSLPFRIGKFYEEPGDHYRRNEADRGCCDKVMTPEKVERKKAGNPVGQEFCGWIWW